MAIKRVDIDGGGWLDLKEKLKIGDKANVQSIASEGIDADRSKFNYNIVRHQIGSAAVRILNWELKDADDKSVEYPVGKSFDERVRVISQLDEDVFERVQKAVEAFEETLSKEKNAQTDGESA